MGLDVRVHVIDKNFKLLYEDLLDYLPYKFRWTFYPTFGPDVYCNVVYTHEIAEKYVRNKFSAMGFRGEWVAVVKVHDVKLYMQETDEDLSCCRDKLEALRDDDVLVVEGDQYYSNLFAPYEGKQFGVQDDWFEAYGEGMERSLSPTMFEDIQLTPTSITC